MARERRPDQHERLIALLQRYERPLVLYALKIVGDPDTARDVVQDVFLRLCREDIGRMGEHVVAWLYTVCRNRALDVTRRENRMRLLTDPLADACDFGDAAPDAAMAREETTQSVLDSIQTLSDDQQEILRLKFQAGLSYREIAEVTGQSTSNVGYLLHTALRALRERLGAPHPTTGRASR